MPKKLLHVHNFREEILVKIPFVRDIEPEIFVFEILYKTEGSKRE